MNPENRRVKFGQVIINHRFWWRGCLFQKINDSQAKIVRNDKPTDKKVEFHPSITVELD